MVLPIRALETTYAGYQFRSRLEARWAAFFDALGLSWEYEPQGYRLVSGECYLPDFLLRLDEDTYAEVKPDADHFGKAKTFAYSLGVPILLLDGPPDYRGYQLYEPWNAERGPQWRSGPVEWVCRDGWFRRDYMPGGARAIGPKKCRGRLYRNAGCLRPYVADPRRSAARSGGVCPLCRHRDCRRGDVLAGTGVCGDMIQQVRKLRFGRRP